MHIRMPRPGMTFDHANQHKLHTYLMDHYSIRLMAPIIAEFGGILVEYEFPNGNGTFIVQYRFKEGDIFLYWGQDIAEAFRTKIKLTCASFGFMVSDS